MVPEVFLFTLGDPAALLITNLNDLAEDFVKLLNMLIRSIHILECHIEKSVNDISAEIDEDFDV